MRKLGMSEEEIKQLLDDDKRIDRGEKLFELPDELKQGAKKARQAERTAPKTAKRERKVDDNKRFLIDFLVKALLPEADKEIEVINPEREFTFFYNNEKFKIVLSKPRT